MQCLQIGLRASFVNHYVKQDLLSLSTGVVNPRGVKQCTTAMQEQAEALSLET